MGAHIELRHVAGPIIGANMNVTTDQPFVMTNYTSALMRIDPPMLNKTDPPTKSPMAEADPTGGCGQSMLDSLW
jgi:hypothetical protein